MKTVWSDLHLYSLHGVVGPVPAVPSHAICALGVQPSAVEHAIQVGVCAAVVPVATCWGQRITFIIVCGRHLDVEHGECFQCGSGFLCVHTFAQGGAVVHALVVVLVLGAEVGVVVVAQRVAGVAAVVGQEELVAVELVAQAEVGVLSKASLSLPVLHVETH